MASDAESSASADEDRKVMSWRDTLSLYLDGLELPEAEYQRPLTSVITTLIERGMNRDYYASQSHMRFCVSRTESSYDPHVMAIPRSDGTIVCELWVPFLSGDIVKMRQPCTATAAPDVIIEYSKSLAPRPWHDHDLSLPAAPKSEQFDIEQAGGIFLTIHRNAELRRLFKIDPSGGVICTIPREKGFDTVIGNLPSSLFGTFQQLILAIQSRWRGDFVDPNRKGDGCQIVIGVHGSSGEKVVSRWVYGSLSTYPPDEIGHFVAQCELASKTLAEK